MNTQQCLFGVHENESEYWSPFPSHIEQVQVWALTRCNCNNSDAHRCQISSYGKRHSHDAAFWCRIRCLSHLKEKPRNEAAYLKEGWTLKRRFCECTCPSKAATLAVLTMQPLCPSASGWFFPISPTARRITLKVPAMFTCQDRRRAAWGVIWNPHVCVSFFCSAHVDDTLEVLQTVRDVLLEIVCFDRHGDASTVNCKVQLPELLFGQRHGWSHVCFWRDLEKANHSCLERVPIFRHNGAKVRTNIKPMTAL